MGFGSVYPNRRRLPVRFSKRRLRSGFGRFRASLACCRHWSASMPTAG